MYNLIIDQIKSCWRFRWLAVGVAWAVCIVGWLGISMQRDTYEATARVYVDTTSELRNVLGSQIIQPNVQDQLSFVREAILGSKRLEAVAVATGLDEGVTTEEQMLLLIASLRRNIQIFNQDPPGTMPGNRPTGTTYVITFAHEDPAVAKKVVGTLLDQFVEFSLGDKADSSERAGQFLRQQIRLYEQRLTSAEEELAKFNRRNYDRLPSMQGGYFQRLQDEIRELNGARQRLTLARSRLDQIEEQLRGESPRTRDGEPDPSSIEARIFNAESRLDELLLSYTENHPDVVATQAILEQMRQQQRQMAASGGRATQASNNPVYQALQIAKNEAEEELAIIQADVSDRVSRVEELRARIDEMPQVEAELARLNRDYEVINDHYQSLLNSLERERLSANVFESEKIDFRVIEPPRAGSTPVAPKRGLLLFMVFVIGCGAAVGTAYLLSQFVPIVGSVEGLIALSSVPVIGAISRVRTQDDGRRWLLTVAYVALAFVGLGLTFVGVFAFEVMGPGLRSFL